MHAVPMFWNNPRDPNLQDAVDRAPCLRTRTGYGEPPARHALITPEWARTRELAAREALWYSFVFGCVIGGRGAELAPAAAALHTRHGYEGGPRQPL